MHVPGRRRQGKHTQDGAHYRLERNIPPSLVRSARVQSLDMLMFSGAKVAHPSRPHPWTGGQIYTIVAGVETIYCLISHGVHANQQYILLPLSPHMYLLLPSTAQTGGHTALQHELRGAGLVREIPLLRGVRCCAAPACEGVIPQAPAGIHCRETAYSGLCGFRP